MLLPSPETQKRLEKYRKKFDAIEAKAITHEQKRARHLTTGLVKAVAGIALLGSGVSGYTHDVIDNQELQAEASITVQYEGPALHKENDHTGLVFIDGFGTDGADTITKYYGEAIQPVIDGKLLSVGYNNAPLETPDIAHGIIDTVVPLGITDLVLVGHSAGGDIAMQVQELIRKESGLSIDAVILVSTPNGVDTLRPARQDEIDLVKNVSWIPGVHYSSPIRFMSEMALRSDNYTHGADFWENSDNFITTYNQVQTNLDNNKLPGMWLMFDQMLAIETANLKDRIDDMKKIPINEVKPTVIYLSSAGYDPIVNDQLTGEQLGVYAHKAGVPYLTYAVPGADHSRPDLNAGYIKTMAEAKVDIQSSIAQQQAIASLHRITSTYHPLPKG